MGAVMDPVTKQKVRFVRADDEGDASWSFATPELAAWLRAEAAGVRRARSASELPRRYWKAGRAVDEHDPRGTASWLADAGYIPTHGDICQAPDS